MLKFYNSQKSCLMTMNGAEFDLYYNNQDGDGENCCHERAYNPVVCPLSGNSSEDIDQYKIDGDSFAVIVDQIK